MMRLWKGKAELVQEGGVVCVEGCGKGVGVVGGWSSWTQSKLYSSSGKQPAGSFK